MVQSNTSLPSLLVFRNVIEGSIQVIVLEQPTVTVKFQLSVRIRLRYSFFLLGIILGVFFLSGCIWNEWRLSYLLFVIPHVPQFYKCMGLIKTLYN